MRHKTSPSIQAALETSAMTATISSVNSNDKCQGKRLNRPKRAFASCTPKWQKFQQTLIIPSEKAAVAASESATYLYNRQYSHVYANRLVALRNRCWDAISKKRKEVGGSTSSPAAVEVKCVLELQEDVPSLIVGTLVKESASDGDNDKQDSPLLHPRSRCRDSDQLYLEDESGRVALQVDNVHEYCTGIVVGVKGAVDKNGILPVEEMYTPEPKAHAKLQAPSLQSSGGSQAPHLLLVSGLRCGDADVSSLPRDMLLAYLQGHFTPDAQKVCRVIICGGGPSSAPTTNGSMSSSTFGVRELDTWGLQLGATGIPVDILPGKLDPTTANWPQRPFHSSLFPKSKSTGLWNHSPNPYAAGHGPRLVIGTDGENVHDLCHSMLAKVKESEITKDSPSDDSHDNVQERSSYIPISELEALKKTLEWAHMCPTGPDSVPTIPHPEMDPMVLDTTPHVYFAGNATEFATDLVTNDEAGTSTRVVCVPNFADTGAAVLVNLETLGVEVLRFEDDCNSR